MDAAILYIYIFESHPLNTSYYLYGYLYLLTFSEPTSVFIESHQPVPGGAVSAAAHADRPGRGGSGVRPAQVQPAQVP